MCYVEELTFLIQVKDDLTELAGTIAGPPDTPYQGGKFKLEIKIPDTYPFNPPKVIIYSSYIKYYVLQIILQLGQR